MSSVFNGDVAKKKVNYVIKLFQMRELIFYCDFACMPYLTKERIGHTAQTT